MCVCEIFPILSHGLTLTDDGSEAIDGESGELRVKGANVFKEYGQTFL